jgi:integrase
VSIRKHTTKSGRTAYYVYLKADGAWRYIGKAPTRDDARALERNERNQAWQVAQGLRQPETDETFLVAALPWANRRVQTHRRGCDDLWRMKKHLIPFFGDTQVKKIDLAQVRAFIDHARRKTMGVTTLHHCIRLLGRFLNELVLDGKLPTNPVARLDRATRRLFKSTHDPRKTPFIRKKEDIAALYCELSAEVRVMFALGVFAGLRTGEILGLRIEDTDLPRRCILVQRSYGGITKDEDPRAVPVNDSLLPLLTARLRHLGRTEGLVFPPSGHGEFVKSQRLRDALHAAQQKLGFPGLTWYQSTRHTFASHWVMDGRPIEKLRDILGHSTVQVTERYAHLSPDAFGRADYAAVFVDLTAALEPSGTDRDGSGEQAEKGVIGHNRGTTA